MYVAALEKSNGGRVMDENKVQAERFKEAAREVGADESADALDRVMGKLDLKKKVEPEQPKGPAGDKE
jgi:hypothetical protein